MLMVTPFATKAAAAVRGKITIEANQTASDFEDNDFSGKRL